MRRIIKTINKMIALSGLDYRLIKKDNPRNIRKLLGKNKDQFQKQLLTDGMNAVFFGYHDKTPFSQDNNRILANSVAADDTKPESEGSLMKVGYFEKMENNKFKPEFINVSKTTTWSWQQGCMLQWNPLKPDREIIFNKMINGKYGAVFMDIQSKKEVKHISMPIYSVDPTGKYASSLNFSRLSRIRTGYGYKNIPDPTYQFKAPEGDGLYLIDLESGKAELIADLSELAEHTVMERDHYINHVTFSPDGMHLAFFHFYGDDQIKRINRFYLYDIGNKKLRLLEAFRTVSHYCWRSPDEIITTENGPGGCLYYLYNINSKTKIRIDLPNIGDLHPMVHPVDTDMIVADSKPDRILNQHLFIFNLSTGSTSHIGTFHSPKEYRGPVRCDLHPRWDRKGEFVAVDVVNDGKRCLAVVKYS